MFKRYPGLTFIGLSYIAAILVVLFIGSAFFHDLVTPFGIGGVFLAGMLYTYSFTAGFATIFLPPFADTLSIPMIAVVGGVGAAFADVLIFRFIRSNLKKEIHQLAANRALRKITRSSLFKNFWIRNTIGIVVLASPLPDELGVLIMANTHLKEESFAMISFLANTTGIYILVSSLAFLF